MADLMLKPGGFRASVGAEPSPRSPGATQNRHQPAERFPSKKVMRKHNTAKSSVVIQIDIFLINTLAFKKFSCAKYMHRQICPQK